MIIYPNPKPSKGEVEITTNTAGEFVLDFTPPPPLLCLKALSKSFAQKQVLAGVDLALYPQQVVSLLGCSGSGKSTVFNIAAGLLQADQGAVLLNGVDITGQAGKVAYMLQKDLLLPHLSTVANVALPLLIKGQKKAEAHELAASYFAEFGLAGTEKLYPAQLSGGMAQRAAFLRTWLFSAEIALLDEPFSALDAITRRQLQIWFLAMVRKLKQSSLIITHDIDEALILSDRILVLGGKPARIISEFTLPPQGQRELDFSLSPSFLEYKRSVLAALDSSSFTT